MRRSTTVGTLTEANRLFAAGDTKGAREKLGSALAEVKKGRSAAVAAAKAPAAKAKVDKDFARQEAALGAAADAFAAPPAEGEAAARSKPGRFPAATR